MKANIFRSVGAKLSVIVFVMLVGFIVIVATAIQVFGQLDQAFERREHLVEQDLLLRQLQKSVLESVILIDKVLLEKDGAVIPRLLALNEDTLALFGRYQSDAETFGLLHDVYSAQENQPVIF